MVCTSYVGLRKQLPTIAPHTVKQDKNTLISSTPCRMRFYDAAVAHRLLRFQAGPKKNWDRVLRCWREAVVSTGQAGGGGQRGYVESQCTLSQRRNRSAIPYHTIPHQSSSQLSIEQIMLGVDLHQRQKDLGSSCNRLEACWSRDTSHLRVHGDFPLNLLE